MMYKILFISTMFFYLVNMQQLDNGILSKSAQPRKRTTNEENVDKIPTEKELWKILQSNNDNIESAPNKPNNDKESPIVYLKIDKLNVLQYKDSIIEKIEKELKSDTFAIKDHLDIATLGDLKSNTTDSDSELIKNIGNFSRRLLLDKLSTSDILVTTKQYSYNETLQSPTNISRNNNSTRCNLDDPVNDISEKKIETIIDTEIVINDKEGQSNESSLKNVNVTESRNMVTEHPRLCYVCNSITDPSCWSPSRKTAVKYCREEQQFCLTHVYMHDDAKNVVRECGNTCVSTAFSEGSDSFSSCTLCYTDLCNNGYYVKAQSFVYVILILFKLYFN